jgi:hypothetical protein
MLASIPASILNHIRHQSGIPPDSEKISHALTKMTEELRARSPALTQAQAFARVYQESANAELAARERQEAYVANRAAATPIAAAKR